MAQSVLRWSTRDGLPWLTGMAAFAVPAALILRAVGVPPIDLTRAARYNPLVFPMAAANSCMPSCSCSTGHRLAHPRWGRVEGWMRTSDQWPTASRRRGDSWVGC